MLPLCARHQISEILTKSLDPNGELMTINPLAPSRLYMTVQLCRFLAANWLIQSFRKF